MFSSRLIDCFCIDRRFGFVLISLSVEGGVGVSRHAGVSGLSSRLRPVCTVRYVGVYCTNIGTLLSVAIAAWEECTSSQICFLLFFCWRVV